MAIREMPEAAGDNPPLMYMPSPVNASSTGSPATLVAQEYDPGITEEVDRAIRNMPGVVQYCNRKAHELCDATGSSNFEVVLSQGPDQQRPRAYVVPSNSKGIHEELAQAVLLKAALGMAGR